MTQRGLEMAPDTEPETPLRLLRGRVMIRPIVERVTGAGIIIPNPEARSNKPSLGRGVVVMAGPPAYNKSNTAIVPQEFKVGDLVLYVGQHVSRKIVWNGEEVAMVSQEEVQCVLEPDDCHCCGLPTDKANIECGDRAHRWVGQ